MNILFIFENFISWIDYNYFFALFLFFLFIFFAALFSIPGWIPYLIFAGYAFGVFFPFLVCMFAFLIGSLFFFVISKHFLSKFFKKYYMKIANKINFFIKDSSIEYLIIFRLIPGPPLMLQNIILSLLDISFYKFIISTFLGFMPIVFISVFVGNKIKNIQLFKDISTKDIITWDFVLFILLLIMILILKIIFNKKN